MKSSFLHFLFETPTHSREEGIALIRYAQGRISLMKNKAQEIAKKISNIGSSDASDLKQYDTQLQLEIKKLKDQITATKQQHNITAG